MIDSENEGNILQISFVNARIIENQGSFNLTLGSNYAAGAISSTKVPNPQNATMLRIYIYIDDAFQYKTEIFGQSNTPILDLRIKIEIPPNSKTIRFDMYDAQNLAEIEMQQV